MELAAVVCRFALAAVFIRAALPKLSHLDEFERAVRRYDLLPARASRILGRSLPFAELACGALLFVGFGTAPVASIIGAFLLVFTGAVGINLARGREIDCGCFSTVVPNKIGWRTVFRNLFLLAASVLVVWKIPTALSLDRGLLSQASSVSDGDAFAALIATILALSGASLVRDAARLFRVAARLEGLATAQVHATAAVDGRPE